MKNTDNDAFKGPVIESSPWAKDRRKTPAQPCYIIAEAGVNHNGNLELAKELIDAAADAGADAIKFQTWVTEKLVTPKAAMADYQKNNIGNNQTQFEMLKKLELSYDCFRELKLHAQAKNILFLSTPDEEDSADFLDELGVPVFKIGSGEISNLPFLQYVARKKKPIILSTGMSTLADVEAAIRAIEEEGTNNIVLLHCVSNYPAAPEDCNLRAMDTMATAFNYPVGYSNHALGIEVSLAAIARGACLIETHFTLDKRMHGPDHAASLDIQELRALVQGAQSVVSAIGDGVKRPTNQELETKKVVQKRIVAARKLRAGAIIQPQDIVLRRTDGGLEPAHLNQLVGRTLKANIDAFAPLHWELLR